MTMEQVDFSVRKNKPIQFNYITNHKRLDLTKYNRFKTLIRQNTITTFDNILIKTDFPDYEGSFFDYHRREVLDYPLGLP